MKNNHYIGYAAVAAAFISIVPILAGGCGGSSHSSSSSTSGVVDQTPTLSNLKKLGLAMDQYTEDNDERLPNVTTTAAVKPLLMTYTHDSSVFVDPNNNVPFTWNGSLAAQELADISNPSMTITFYDAQPPVPISIPVGLLDGSAHLETPSNFAQLKSISGIP